MNRINKTLENITEKMAPLKLEGKLKSANSYNCPHCGMESNSTEGISDIKSGHIAKSKPITGDVSICSECGGPSIFNVDENENISLRKATEEEMETLMEDDYFKNAVALNKMMLAAKDKASEEDYYKMLDKMLEDILAWRKEHSDTQPAFQFPDKQIGVICTFKQAIDNKIVAVNQDALNMFNDLKWLDDKDPKAPTVFMVQMVLDKAFGNAE